MLQSGRTLLLSSSLRSVHSGMRGDSSKQPPNGTSKRNGNGFCHQSLQSLFRSLERAIALEKEAILAQRKEEREQQLAAQRNQQVETERAEEEIRARCALLKEEIGAKRRERIKIERAQQQVIPIYNAASICIQTQSWGFSFCTLKTGGSRLGLLPCTTKVRRLAVDIY